MDKELIKAAAGEASPAVLVTVIEVRGSAPRHPGSKMLVLASGEIRGTIGGGKGESLAIEAAMAALRDRASSFLDVEMLGSDAQGKDLICGGVNRMLVEYLSDQGPYADALASLTAGTRVVLEKRLSRGVGQAVGVEVIVHREGETLPEAAAKAASSGAPVLSEQEGLFFDPLLPEEKLLILGGGHVGLALAMAALPLGFVVSVADDRPDFLTHERFGPQVGFLLGSYAETIAAFPSDASTYAVILTRGHLFDLESCRALLGKRLRYLGLIGSTRKIGLIRDQLEKDGYAKEAVASLHAPIGLPIGAETPEEIAVSILAEIVACRRNALPA